MEQFIENLENDLAAAFSANDTDPNILYRYSCNIREIREALVKLRIYILENPFAGKQEEIHYFKHVAPRLYSKLFYFQKIYQVELERSYAGKGKLLELLRQELHAIDQFYNRHGEFCHYYHAQGTYMDEQLFTKEGLANNANAIIDEVLVIMDADYCVGSYWVARIKTNQELRRYLEKQLQDLENPQSGGTPLKSPSILKWKRNKRDLFEVCLGIYLTRGFGDVTFKQVVEWFQEITDTDLGHYYNTEQELARRKKNRTQYMDEMKNSINEKFDAMD